MKPTVLPADPCQRSVRLLAHQPMVHKIAHRLRARLPANVEMDELVQVGMIGLNEALARFEGGRGATFDTYASRRIQGAMLDSLREADALSRDARQRQRHIRVAVQVLEHRLGRAPRAKEVANELGWTLDLFYKSMLEAGAAPTRLEDEALERVQDEASVRGAADEAPSHSLSDDQGDPQRALQRRQRHLALAKAFGALDERERSVMDMIYVQELELAQIGAQLGLSPSRVSRIHEATVAKLRLRMRSW